jgi:phosphoribosylamine--glycine ligase
MKISIIGTFLSGSHFLSQWFERDPKIKVIRELDRADLVLSLNSRNALLNRELTVPHIAPTRTNAMLEWDRVYTKTMFQELGIPTPAFRVFGLTELLKRFNQFDRPFVIKFNRDNKFGMQTIIVTDDNYSWVYEYIQSSKWDYADLFLGEERNFLVEEYLPADREYSYHALFGRQNWRYFGSACDYKKSLDGYNTPGMGSYFTDNIDTIVHDYTDKIYNYLKKTDPYIGIIFLGILVSNGIPYVLEINIRSGDPEIQTIVPAIENSFADLLYVTATGNEIPTITFNNLKPVSVSLWGEGSLPAPPEDVVYSLCKAEAPYHGTVTAIKESVEQSRNTLYTYLDGSGFTYRTDIGLLL